MSLSSEASFGNSPDKELYSLIRFSGETGRSSTDSTPYIDTKAFDFFYGDEIGQNRFIDVQCWTSTEYISTTMGGNPTAHVRIIGNIHSFGLTLFRCREISIPFKQWGMNNEALGAKLGGHLKEIHCGFVPD